MLLTYTRGMIRFSNFDGLSRIMCSYPVDQKSTILPQPLSNPVKIIEDTFTAVFHRGLYYLLSKNEPRHESSNNVVYVTSKGSDIQINIYNAFQLQFDMSRDMRNPTMCYVRPAKAQTSLRIRAVGSVPLLVA